MILDNKEIFNIIQAIYIKNTFFFAYDVYKKAKIKENYFSLGYNINNFIIEAKIVIEFQVNFKDFKACKNIVGIKAYLLYYLKIYFLNNLSSKTLSTFIKYYSKNNK